MRPQPTPQPHPLCCRTPFLVGPLMASVANVHLADAMKDLTITVTVTGQRGLAWRLWMATKLFQFGAWIAGCGIVIDTDDTQADAR